MIHWYWVWPERLIIKLSSNCWLVPGIIGHHRVKTSDSSMAGAGHRAVCGTALWGILGTRRNLNKSWSSRVGERRGEGHHGSKPEDGDHEGRVMQGWARLWMWGGGRSGTQLRISENIINNRVPGTRVATPGSPGPRLSEPRPENCFNWLIPARGQARVIRAARAARHPD